MAKCLACWSVRCLVLVGLAVVWAGSARAAGDWEWTEGQGWRMGVGVSRPTPKEQLHYAYDLEQRGEFMDAARQYFLLVQNFPESNEAGIGLQRLARCLFEMENYYTSYKAIEQVIETYPNTGRMSDLVEIELRIAKKMMVSQTPDILAGRGDNSRISNVRRALEIVGSVIEHDPYGPVAAEAYLVKGEGNLFLNEIATARQAFETVRDEFPRSDFVERARLGILQCDNLVGQARPQELIDQLDLVREAEAQRQQRGSGGLESELDDVEGSVKQLLEVEANKMMTQAEQYGRMGTKQGKSAEKFLYNEIVRRYPGSPQAETAMDRLGTIRIPKDPGRVASTIRNIKWNPFSWNKDPEPPWVVPQLDPEDVVMVDNGMGPILGVAETGVPQTAYSAGVRPATLSDSPASADLGLASSGAPFSPAPPFIDGVGEPRVYSSQPQNRIPVAPPVYDPPPPRVAPLPTATEDDLIPMGGAPTMRTLSGGYSGTPAPVPYQGYSTSGSAPVPEPAPGYYAPAPQPTLNHLDYNTPTSDLVGPARRVVQPPLPEYDYSAPSAAYQGGNAYYDDPYAAPRQTPAYADPYYATGGYGQPPTGYAPRRQDGGWTLSEDFR